MISAGCTTAASAAPADGRASRGALRRRDGGSVSAETAVVLPVIVAMLMIAMLAIGVVVARIRCLDAARDVARAVARGEPVDEARHIGQRAAPPGSAVELTRVGDDVTAIVKASVAVDWPVLGWVRGIDVSGRATVQVEPGEPDRDAS